MKPIKRLEDSDNKIVGKPVKINKDCSDWQNEQEAEKESDKDDRSPRLNFSSRSAEPPSTTYDDFGDSVQSRIFKK